MTGEFKFNERPAGYLNCHFHRIIKDFMLQGGDFLNNNGTGSMSIFKDQNGSALEKFADENFNLKHDRAGLLSMANSGPNTNGCQFFITCRDTSFLDGRHVVFGQVVEDQDSSESMLTVRKMESVSTNPQNERPKLEVKIAQCG